MTGMEVIAALAGNLVSDAAAAKGFALASTLGLAVAETVKKLSRRRMETARDIMVEEVRLGTKSLDDAAQLEEIVACMLRYGRAAEEGAARLNLRLMAAVMNGMYSKSCLTASGFLYYADLLASLKREEIILIACLHRRNNSDDIIIQNGREKEDVVLDKASQELVPEIFSNRDEFDAYCVSASRTGLISTTRKWGGVSAFKPTPILEKLLRYTEIESVLERDRRMNEQHAAA